MASALNWTEIGLVAAMPLLGRLVPFLGYVALSRGRTIAWRLGWAALLVGAFVGANSIAVSAGFLLIDVALANAWLMLAGVLLHLYIRYGPNLGRIGDGSMTTLCAFAVPLAVFPSEMWPVAGPVSWEFGLAGYSYLQKTRRKPRGDLGDCLFFLLLNPVLLYSGPLERVTNESGRLRFGLTRVLGGYLAILGALVVQRLLAGHVTSSLALVVLFLVVQYGTHAGRAGQDVGLLRCMGHDIPERYQYPFLAKSPQDFWTRWNTYVGNWAKEHLFFQASRAGRKMGLSPTVAVASAVLTTFVVVGLLHEAMIVWVPGSPLGGITSWFALNAALLLAWRVAEGLLPRERGLARRLGHLAARVAAFLGVGLAAKELLW